MERGAFRLPTVEFWSRPLQWVGHESTRKSSEPNSDSNSRVHLALYKIWLEKDQLERFPKHFPEIIRFPLVITLR